MTVKPTVYHIPGCLWRTILALSLLVLSGQTRGQAPIYSSVDSLPDSIATRYTVRPTVPSTYDELMSSGYSMDLDGPDNIVTTAEYDPQTGAYVMRTRMGQQEIATPFMLTAEQYAAWQNRSVMRDYLRRRNSLQNLKDGDKEAFNVLDMNFDIGPLEKIFGPGGVRIRTNGSLQLSTGIKSTKTDNPSLNLNSRRKTYFDFDQKIQATVNASVGDRLKFDMSYNTDATFEFDSKNLKLRYDGTEDDIVNYIEAGNVEMTTGSSLIRGATALFGVKTQLQFGRLTATALVSQQNSESRRVTSRRGVQTTEFTIEADAYDQNRHFFLSQYFRDNYDSFASRLPLVSSGINITRIEVWVTNRSGNFSQSRNLTAFVDLGETSHLASRHWTVDPSLSIPSNGSNNLMEVIRSQYPGARNVNTVTQSLAPLEAYGIYGARDYAKIESARLLSSSEYTLNASLGYISLKARLNADEVLAVAYEYTYGGKVYQVGEFSSDVTETSSSLYVKMLKSMATDVNSPMWRLAMKNVYATGAYQLQKSNFNLSVRYLSDTTGTDINYLPIHEVSGKTLLQLMGLDRLDTNLEGNPDGFFDYIEGYTVLSSQGLIIFPVAEPFGSNLIRQIGNPSAAQPFVYQELYDSTIVVARQYADKNKFILKGQYQASEGSQISLNAVNVPRGSVVVTAGGVTLVENADYTVDYAMGMVTITNTSIIESGQSIDVTLENQSLFSTQRKTLLGLDLSYRLNDKLTLGSTILRYTEKALTEKVNIGDETVSNTMLGVNFAYNTDLGWLTDLLNGIPTINATAPSRVSVQGEVATLQPSSRKSGTNNGSSYIDDFESTQSGYDIRSPYSWFLASTPYDPSAGALFPEAALSDNVEYGMNRALLNWYFIDRLFTSKNSSLAPSYIKTDLKQLSNPYVREVTSREIFPDRQLTYGESSTIQTLNLSFYPEERGPYNLDATNIDSDGRLLNPERRWGGMMRKLDNSDFEQSNIEYVQFWLMNPFLDPENPNYDGGDLYFNFGDISEDILKDGLKSYENGVPVDGAKDTMRQTVWGRVSRENSLAYAFDNNNTARPVQDVGLDGLRNDDEYEFSSYSDYLTSLRSRLSASTAELMADDPASAFNDPAGDNYHFYRGYDYDERRLGVLERYKRYNNPEGNSLSSEDSGEQLYQPSRNTPDVEDINQDNTLNEYERYYQYRVSIRPQDLEVGRNYVTDKQVSLVRTRDGSDQEVEWYQFKIPLSDYEKTVGSISDFSSIRFVRMFMTGFKAVTHLRFATLELVRGEWRAYTFNLNSHGDVPAQGQLDISSVNIEENSSKEPVNYILPPGVSRISDPSQSQIVQLNEQSMSLSVKSLEPGDARGVYRNTMSDLRNYARMQMWVHAEAAMNNPTNLSNGETSLFMRLGSDVKNNYYEIEIPLSITPPGRYTDTQANRAIVWPESNFLDVNLQAFVELKRHRNMRKAEGATDVGYGLLYTEPYPDDETRRISVMGNPTLANVKVMLIGVRNSASTVKDVTVWVNELKVTEFNSKGGWAVKAAVNLAMSDIAALNFASHIETAGFGSVDQALNDRRMDDYRQYSFAMQADLGRFAPSKLKLRAPVYYSVSKETVSPLYNPLDTDVRLSEALDACATDQQRDSIKAYAVENTSSVNFSVSGLTFERRSKRAMPWDPANFNASFSMNKQSKNDPTTEYQHANDYRGSLSYAYAPSFTPLRPMSRIVKSQARAAKFFRDWELNYLPTAIRFQTVMSRYYYEQQTRSDNDDALRLPVSVSKNFLWDRQLNLSWNLTKNLTLAFASNTAARIEEPTGAVNRRLFPDEYREWRDTVVSSILRMGTPWAYNQSFNATYRAPFAQLPFLDFLTANASYNSIYNWSRGASVDGMSAGNSVANQGAWNLDGRVNFEGIYNKIPFLKNAYQRFSVRKNSTSNKRTGGTRARRFRRTYTLQPDTALVITHNLRAKKVGVRAVKANTSVSVPVKWEPIDDNSIRILTRGDDNLDFTVTEVLTEHSGFWFDLAQYASRAAMSIKNVSARWRRSNSMSLPLFIPEVGNILGQSHRFGPMSPGLAFAFGFTDESYVQTAKDRGWLITDGSQTSPAIWNSTSEINLELNLEPAKGLKISLYTNRSDNRTAQIQFMFDDMPTAYSGSFTMTYCALGSALRSSGNAENGYQNTAFNRLLDNIPVMTGRIENAYDGLKYPSTGFMHGSELADKTYSAEYGRVSSTSGDVLIPAFLSAYSGRSPHKQFLSLFPSLSQALPNWKVTYDGLTALLPEGWPIRNLTLQHAYQCTYSVASYSSFLNWEQAPGASGLGFIPDQQTNVPVPSSPYNISSVVITERFAPLAGATATLNNGMTLNMEWRNQRTLTLNTSAAQVVEATTSGVTAGMGYKIVGFNTFLRMRGSERGISNDLTLNGEFSYALQQALVRKIETAITQATSGSRIISFNFVASYVLSRRLTVGMFVEHQINTPLVSTASYPTTNSAYGITLNLSLAR